MIFKNGKERIKMNPWVSIGYDIRPSKQRVILRSLLDSGRLAIKKDARWVYAYLDGRFINLVSLIDNDHCHAFRNMLYTLANTMEAIGAKLN